MTQPLAGLRPPAADSTDPALADALLGHADGDWQALRAFAQRTGSALARLALEQASGSTDPLARSQAALLLATSPEPLPADLDRARDLLGSQPRDGSDGEGDAGLREAWAVLAQALLRAGRDREVTEILDAVDLDPHLAWVLRTDLANPARTGDRSEGAVHRFLELFNEPFVADGLEPITLDPFDAADDDFVSLRARPTETVAGDDLVTVVMSAFRPSQEIRTAVRSILDQSWQAWELLIVDDNSGPEFSGLLEEVAAADARIRLLRSPANRGTYSARNLALTQARGRWMTFQDSDDWSHPRRLERQVRRLQGRKRLLADRSLAVRAHADLSLTYPGYPAERVNASSLLFEVAPVHALIGDFEPVRMSADVEYPLRLRAAATMSLADPPELGHLAVTLLRGGSLSRADSRPGWLHWTRTAYLDAFRAWHREIRSGTRSPRIVSDGPRPFALPDPRFAADRSAPVPPSAQVVLLGDLRGPAPRARGAAELAGLLNARRQVGLAHAETPAPLRDRRQPTHHVAQERLDAGAVGYAHLSRADHIPLLVVTDPATLLHADAVAATVDRVLVLASGWRQARTWSVAAVDARVTQLWSVRAIWATTNADDREALAAEHPELRVWEQPLPWALDPDALRPARSRRTDGYVVAGNQLPDEAERWQVSRQQLESVFPQAETALDVRVMGGQSTLARIWERESLPPGWVNLRSTGTTLLEFLRQLDVLVYLGTWDDDAEVAVLEALAAELPVLLAGPSSGLPADLRDLVRVEPLDELGAAVLAAPAQPVADAEPALRARARTWLDAVDRLLDGEPPEG